jgi:hypothetical protein
MNEKNELLLSLQELLVYGMIWEEKAYEILDLSIGIESNYSYD